MGVIEKVEEDPGWRKDGRRRRSGMDGIREVDGEGKGEAVNSGKNIVCCYFVFSSTPSGAKHQKASVLSDYPDHTPASGFSRSASVPQAGLGCIEAGAARVIRAACLCSAVMSLRLCSALMSFLHNEGPQGAAGEGG